MWLAVTSAVTALVDVILGLAASLALSVAQLFDEQWASGWRIIPTTRSSSSRRSPTVHSV